MNSRASDRAIQLAYNGATRHIMRFFAYVSQVFNFFKFVILINILFDSTERKYFFLQVIKFYHQNNAPNIGTHQLHQSIDAYHFWYEICNTWFQLMQIPYNFQNCHFLNIRAVTMRDIRTQKRTMEESVKTFSETVISSEYNE